ncbi:MAG: ABC transporter ATP-binding protein/permease [Rhodothermia bacterium]|nr:ABC transporter ATP-binding protein/permease [Rhodothermia bacterium]
MKALNRIRERIALVRRALQLVFDAASRWTLAWAVTLIVQGVLPALTIYISKLLIDELVGAIGQGAASESIRGLVVLGAIMGTLLLLGYVLSSVGRWIRTALSETFRDHLRGMLHAQANRLDLAFYESSAYHDRLHRVMGEVSQRPLVMLESLGGVLQSFVTLLGMAALIILYAWWLPFVLVIGAVPALVVALRFSRRRHAWWKKRTADERWAQYYETLLTHSSVAAEMRLFGLGSHFRDLYQSLRQRLRSERIALERGQLVEAIPAALAALIITAAVMVWITLRALRGLATLGDVALFYQTFSRGQNLMRTMLVGIGQVYDSSLFVSELFDFMSLEPLTAGPATRRLTRHPSSVRFDDVSFSYPGTESRVLKNVSVQFERGQTVAIVGENGAGKSTLLKLLCRFYDPSTGDVSLDGISMRLLDPMDVWKQTTVLFQFPVQYHASAADNIAYGELGPSSESSRIEAAARSAGIHDKITSLPSEYQTLLGRWFVDGQELSGGEWQRLAMARAFYRDAPILVLDEPTSMLDSWAEGEWFDRFKSLVEDRIGIIITHRFTIARRADVIHVMRDGRIVESGTHGELVAMGGLYSSSWNEQVAASA